MQTKTTIQFWKHFNALFNLLLPQQWPLGRRFYFDQDLCADCWQGLVLSPRLFANAVGSRLPMPLAINFAGLVSQKHHPCPKSKAAFFAVTGHGN